MKNLLWELCHVSFMYNCDISSPTLYVCMQVSPRHELLFFRERSKEHVHNEILKNIIFSLIGSCLFCMNPCRDGNIY